ncbi:hypothetical protein ANTPLA_LOCUS5411 [Anthophora plagiata]
MKIKQLQKITKETGNMVEKLNNQITSINDKVVKCQEFLQNLKKYISSIEDEIEELELLKYHNLHSLVFKQRKVKQLHNVKNRTYKMVYKSENTIEENLQREYHCRKYLKYVLDRTDNDFPMLHNSIKRILLALQIF